MSVQPRHAVACNCSICRSLGTVWGHGDVGTIVIKAKPDATLRYSRGERELAFHTCKVCGSTTHWEAIAGEAIGRMAVNLRLAQPGTIEAIGLRHFDGAETWSFLD
ncbi:GFA family protein [Roseibium sp. MMSF_3412]|uniref:GFA family protein n=1 Tax=Roseibium sp. MMSF_3412 TaxID=3046712 RepID=UPI00273F7DBB|nr:GFA family protein [Roseibium sp. MMSF_3412]